MENSLSFWFVVFSYSGLIFSFYLLVGQWPIYAFRWEKRLDDLNNDQRAEIFINSLKVLIWISWFPLLIVYVILIFGYWMINTTKRELGNIWRGYLTATS